MFKSYSVMFMDVEIGKIYESNRRLHYIPSEDANTPICYPLGLYTRRELNDLELLKGVPVDERRVRKWLDSRVFPKEREGSWAILKKMELDSYDTWEIAKSTKAVTFKDYYWIKVDEADTFETVHPRASEYKKHRRKVDEQSSSISLPSMRRGLGGMIFGVAVVESSWVPTPCMKVYAGGHGIVPVNAMRVCVEYEILAELGISLRASVRTQVFEEFRESIQEARAGLREVAAIRSFDHIRRGIGL